MKKLEKQIERLLSYCKNELQPHDKWTFFNQAFGAIEMYGILFPEQEKEVNELWTNKYRPEFLKDIIQDF